MPVIEAAVAISTAVSAFKTLKSAVSAGKELGECASTLGSWAGAIADLQYCNKRAQKPSVFKTFAGSAEQEAAESFANMKRIQAMQKELHLLIGWRYGPKGLKEYLDMTRQIKAQREATVIRKEEIKQSIISATVGILAGLVGIGLIIALVYALLWKDGQI